MSLSFSYIYIYILVGWWTEPDMYVTFMIDSLDGSPDLTNYFIRMGPKGYSVSAHLFPHFEPKKGFLKKAKPKIVFG